jgi:hypothetical protein
LIILNFPAENMSPRIIAETLEQRLALAASVLRLNPEEMKVEELDLAMALLLEKPVMVEEGIAHIQEGDDWKEFSPVTDWDDYGEIISRNGLVVASHERYDDPNDNEKVTGYWYSAHAYVGDTQSEGLDLREVVAEAAAKLLRHNVRYQASWQLPKTAPGSNG